MREQFLVACTIQHPAHRRKTGTLPALLVDSQSLYTWLPAATLEAIGIKREKQVTLLDDEFQPVQRNVGFAILSVHKSFTIDEVVFAERTDRLRLGTRTLQGLQLVIDTPRQKLKPAPHYAAVSPA